MMGVRGADLVVLGELITEVYSIHDIRESIQWSLILLVGLASQTCILDFVLLR